MTRIITQDKSIVIAADVLTVEHFQLLLEAVNGIKGIGGIKLGFTLAFNNLREVVQIVRTVNPDWAVIFDHQKAGCDIPRNGAKFAFKMREAEVDAVIVFPLAGIETEIAWVTDLQKVGLPVILGGEMTHEGFFVSEGGFIADEAPKRMFQIGAQLGVRNFFLPGNKPGQVDFYRNLISGFTEGEDFTVFSCGFFTQGGVITKAGKVAGKIWHGVVGEAIYEAGDTEAMRTAAEKAVAQIV